MAGSATLERVATDLVQAMKDRREREVAVLRMLKAEAQKFHADHGATYVITEEDMQGLVRRQIKQRREAAEQYGAGGAAERAADELAEARVLEGYLAPQMSADQLEALISRTVAELGLTAPTAKDLGRIMGAVMPKVKGQADGTAVRSAAMALLSR